MSSPDMLAKLLSLRDLDVEARSKDGRTAAELIRHHANGESDEVAAKMIEAEALARKNGEKGKAEAK